MHISLFNPLGIWVRMFLKVPEIDIVELDTKNILEHS